MQSMLDATFTTHFRVSANHPALPGHFPGTPIVPGVVLLDYVVAAIAKWRNGVVAGMPRVKFMAPLLPEQDAQLGLREVRATVAGYVVEFRINHAESAIATGLAEISLPVDGDLA